MTTIPELEPHCGSWVCTSPTGERREFFDRRNVEKAVAAGWSAETFLQHIGKVNQEMRGCA